MGVDLVAGVQAGYRFVNWASDVGTIGNVSDATTTITINDHFSITARFEEVSFTVAAGYYHTAGLRSDGTVVAVGDNECGQCDVHDWKYVVQVDANASHTVGLNRDGIVVAVGYNNYEQCNLHR